MSFIDGSVVNVALPAIQRDLATGFGTLQWVFNGYMLSLASLILFGGAAGDRFGRRRIFIVGLLIFVAASVACGLATSPSWLVAARFTQGVGAALLTPTSLAIVGSSYSGDARGAALGTWAAAGALTAALGPPLGGWLVDTIGWRSIFFLNLPIGAAALLLAIRLPADQPVNQSTPLDQSGAVLAVVSLALLTFGLISLGERDLTIGLVALVCAAAAIWIFIRRKAATADDTFALFRERRSRSQCLPCCCTPPWRRSVSLRSC
jgi:MFS family permease